MRMLEQWGRQVLMPRPQSTASTSLSALSARFARDDNGAVALVFGLMVIPCVMLVGFSVDFGRMLAVKAQAQGIADSAALAAGREVQKVSTNFLATATPAATKYWEEHSQQIGHVIQKSVAVSMPPQNNQVTVEASLWVPTPFLSVGSMIAPGAGEVGAPADCAASKWFCQRIVSRSTVTLATGGTNDGTLEVSLMLDVTGSMATKVNNVAKFDSLVASAKDFVNIVLPSNISTDRVRVALVPFSTSVYIGNDASNPLRTDRVNGIMTAGTCANNTAGCELFKFDGKTYSSGSWNSATPTLKRSTDCVLVRSGAGKLTDSSPASQRFPIPYLATDGSCQQKEIVNQWGNAINYPSGSAYAGQPRGVEGNKVVPLTNSNALLVERLNKMYMTSSTAGQIGTAWAWYMLSPSWSSYLPAASEPKPYNTAGNRKVAVLMTDGDYNTQHCKGVFDQNWSLSGEASNKINCVAEAGDSDSHAASLCTSMKAQGITVYTIGFAVSSSAKTMLQACATTTGHYYDATSGDALQMAYRDIALKISRLVLTN